MKAAALVAVGRIERSILVLRGRSGITVDVLAFAILTTTDGKTGFYSVKLPTGKATSRGNFSSQNQVIGSEQWTCVHGSKGKKDHELTRPNS